MLDIFLNYTWTVSWITYARNLLPTYLNGMQILEGATKSHVVPLNLFLNSISTDWDGVTQSLAPFIW
jgi:hypothetical protein